MEFKRKKQPKEVVTAIKYDLSNYLSHERELFSAILKCMFDENVDLSIKRTNRWWKTESKMTKTYNEKILVSLVVIKRLYYFWKWRHLSNWELLWIRWLEKDFWIIKEYWAKYPKIDEIPNTYNEAFQHFRKRQWITMQQLAEIIKKDLNKSSFHRYIKAIKFDQYCSCVSVFLHNLKKYKISDYNKGIVTQALIEFFKWFRIKEYLPVLYLDHVEESLNYQSSFEKVHYSRVMKRSFGKTWDRFCENFSKQTEEKFFSVIKKRV